jgi:hypothetical protein
MNGMPQRLSGCAGPLWRATSTAAGVLTFGAMCLPTQAATWRASSLSLRVPCSWRSRMQKPWRVSLAGLCWRPQVFLPCRTVADGQIIVATFGILLAPLLLGLLAFSLSEFAPFVIFDQSIRIIMIKVECSPPSRGGCAPAPLQEKMLPPPALKKRGRLISSKTPPFEQNIIGV